VLVSIYFASYLVLCTFPVFAEMAAIKKNVITVSLFI